MREVEQNTEHDMEADDLGVKGFSPTTGFRV